MKKTLFILIVVALLGILAAVVVPGSRRTSAAATTTSKTTTGTATTPSTTTASSGTYKDGSYTGTTASNYFDNIQVAIVISGGKITDITTPTLYGDTGRSQSINSYAVPQLKDQALSSQSASIDGVSGASYTTQAYEQSLQSALDQAKA